MKLIALILSFYIFALTAIPCIDKAHDNAVHKTEISQNTTNHHHDQETDHCTPFCTCVCCATSVIQQEYSIYFIEFYFLQEQKDIYEFSFVSNHQASIWQPPKLS